MSHMFHMESKIPRDQHCLHNYQTILCLSLTAAFNEYAWLQNYSNFKTNDNLPFLWLATVVNSVTVVWFWRYTVYCCKPLSQHCSKNIRWTGRSFGASYRISTRRSINQRSIVEICLYNILFDKDKASYFEETNKILNLTLIHSNIIYLKYHKLKKTPTW